MGPEIGVAAAISSAASIGGLALGAAGDVEKGKANALKLQGESEGQLFLAERDKRAAEYGRLRADQTDIGLREELHTTLANIDAVRAAAGIDPTSPTTAALKAEEVRVGDRERKIRRDSILAQSREDELSSGYRHKISQDALRAASSAQTAGYVGAGSTILKGIGSLAARYNK